jgi:hypothetical protein
MEYVKIIIVQQAKSYTRLQEYETRTTENERSRLVQ